MRRLWCVVLVLTLSGVARAEDPPKPEDLHKMYAATLEQLKAAQDRKTELAARVADLEKQLAEANAQNAQLKQQASDFAEKTFFLRTFYAAWVQFIRENALIKTRWELYLNYIAPLTPPAPAPLLDPDWPLSART